MIKHMKKRGFRVEKDFLGSKKLSNDIYYGIQTKRAIENFPISNLRIPLSIKHSIALIKKAATLTNIKLNKIDKKRANAIIKASDEILKGKFDSQFNIDVFQAGAGTSENMNVNEIVANRSLEFLGYKKGSYNVIHPNDDVNMSQSTNDVFHSAIHIASYLEIKKKLLPSLIYLEKELSRKSRKWKNVVKCGRTHIRDAVPMSLGQEFSGYAELIKKDRILIERVSNELLELNLGGTAIGTGINTNPKYKRYVISSIRRLTRCNFKSCKNLFEGTQTTNALASVSSVLKVLATNLVKITSDIRLLSSGPVSGINELILPAVQPGSSIMPAKVNPAVPEMLMMVSFQVMGNDHVVELCNQAGQLELNVMMPLSSYTLLNSIEILSNGTKIFAEKCIKGLKANEKKCREYVEKNPIIVTALTPYIGYKKASEIAKRAYVEEKTVRELILEEKLMNIRTLDKVLNIKNLIYGTETHKYRK